MATRWAVSGAFWGKKWMQMEVFHQLLLGPFSNMRLVTDGGGARRKGGGWGRKRMTDRIVAEVKVDRRLMELLLPCSIKTPIGQSAV